MRDTRVSVSQGCAVRCEQPRSDRDIVRTG